MATLEEKLQLLRQQQEAAQQQPQQATQQAPQPAMQLPEAESLSPLDKAPLQVFKEKLFTEDAKASDFLYNFNYSLADFLGMPMDAAAGVLKLGGLVPNDYSPVGGSESIRDTLRSVGVNLPEEGSRPDNVAERAGRISGASVLPLGAMRAGGAALSTRPLENLSSFQKGLVTSYTKPIRTGLIEAGAVAGSTIGGELAADMYPDNHNAELLGELAGAFTPGIAADIISRFTNVSPVFRNVKRMFSGEGAQLRAEKRLADVVQSRGNALDNLLDESLLNLDPATRSADVGAIALMKAAINRDPELAKQIADSTDASIKIARGLTLGGGNPDAPIDYLKGLRAKAAAKAQESINRLDPNISPVEASRVIRSSVEDSLAQARQTENALWSKLPKDGIADASNVADSMSVILKERTIASDPEDIPNYLTNLVGRLDKQGNFVQGLVVKQPKLSVLKELRSRLGSDITAERAKDAPNRNKIRILSQMQESLYDSLSTASPEYGEAVSYSRELNKQFTQGRIGKLLGYERSGGQAVTEGGTLDFFLGSPENVRKGIAQLRQASPEAIPVMEEAIKGVFLNDVKNPNGAFNVDRARRFLKNKTALLDEFPALKQAIQDSISNQAVVDEIAGAAVGSNLSRFIKDKSVASLYLDADPDKAMHSLLNAKNSEGQGAIMRDMVNMVKQDETGQALSGLKSAFGQYLIRDAEKGSKYGNLSGDRFSRLLRDTEAAAKELFDKDELSRLKRVGEELRRLELRNATQAEGRVITDAPNKIISLVGGTIAARAGAQAGAGTSGASLRTANIFSREYNELLGKLTRDGAEQVVMDAVVDPNKFKVLLQNATPENLKRFNKVFGNYLPSSAVAGSLASQATAQGNNKTAQDLTLEEKLNKLKAMQPTQGQLRSTQQSTMQ